MKFILYFYTFCDDKQYKYLIFLPSKQKKWIAFGWSESNRSLALRFNELSHQTLAFPLCSHLPVVERERNKENKCLKDHFSIISPSRKAFNKKNSKSYEKANKSMKNYFAAYVLRLPSFFPVRHKHIFLISLIWLLLLPFHPPAWIHNEPRVNLLQWKSISRFCRDTNFFFHLPTQIGQRKTQQKKSF